MLTLLASGHEQGWEADSVRGVRTVRRHWRTGRKTGKNRERQCGGPRTWQNDVPMHGYLRRLFGDGIIMIMI
jgi:hypothetical protein